MQTIHSRPVRLTVPRMRWKMRSSVPKRIAIADSAVAFSIRWSAYVSGLSIERRSSLTAYEKNTFAMANVVMPIVRATAVSCASSAHQMTPRVVPPSTRPAKASQISSGVLRIGSFSGRGLRSMRSLAGSP
jgi:hypothetical protein